MAGLRLPLHGRNHRRAGSDPIPNIINWGENTDTDELGLTLSGHGGFDFSTGDGASGGGGFSTETAGGGYSIDTGVGGSGGGGYSVDSHGGGMELTSRGGDISVDSSSLTSGAGEIELIAHNSLGKGSYLDLDGGTGVVTTFGLDGTMRIRLFSTGTKVEILDHNAIPIFEVREDGSVHIKTGTSIIADL